MFLREDVKDSVKPVRKLVKEMQADKAENDFTGGIFDGQLLSLEDIKKLEKLPSKLELIAKVAMMINQVPTRLAVGIKQVPTKLATGVKKVAEGDAEPAEQAAAQA